MKLQVSQRSRCNRTRTGGSTRAGAGARHRASAARAASGAEWRPVRGGAGRPLGVELVCVRGVHSSCLLSFFLKGKEGNIRRNIFFFLIYFFCCFLNICYLPLLVLKGINFTTGNHFHFSWGLKQMEALKAPQCFH